MGDLTVTIMLIFQDPLDTHWEDQSTHIMVIAESGTPALHSEDEQRTVKYSLSSSVQIRFHR